MVRRRVLLSILGSVSGGLLVLAACSTDRQLSSGGEAGAESDGGKSNGGSGNGKAGSGGDKAGSSNEGGDPALGGRGETGGFSATGGGGSSGGDPGGNDAGMAGAGGSSASTGGTSGASGTAGTGGSSGTCTPACSSNQYCDPATTTCKAQVCTPNAKTCSAKAIQTCNATGSGSTLQNCGAGEVCDPNSITCASPVAGSTWANWPMPNPASAGLPNPASYDTHITGVVIDNVTKLMWQRQAAANYTFAAAKTYCEGLSLGGYDDWKVPTRVELVSLIDFTRASPPMIDISTFPGTVSGNYWTSGGSSKFPDSGVWTVDFNYGFVSLGGDPVSAVYPVRCVR